MRGFLIAMLFGFCVSGCSKPNFEERFGTLEQGMTVEQVQSRLGSLGVPMPNLSGDGRKLVIFESGPDQYAVTFQDDACTGFRMMPAELQADLQGL